MDQPFVMIAEDEPIIGYDLCLTVEEAGCEVEGPLPDVSSAMLSCQRRKPDLAILDINLGREEVYPLAEKLLAEDVKVIFHSALYFSEEVQERFPDAVMVGKPCPPSALLATVHRVLETHGQERA
ncbi:response regulator [Erythrobacter sp. SDW2]|uniref:response regulator n=1 Tax=Erythrobacter sp. SDW2 TaxID=2907154 RepID=UPI001F171EF4|nr:response regulator [Erythrobacter sp. SDW2]UIP07867.1 response regulator [Erythrobacter sp. SDW2]